MATKTLTLHSNISVTGTSDSYHSYNVSDINTWLKNNIPQNAVISNATLSVTGYWTPNMEAFGGSMVFYLACWFCDDASSDSGTCLLGDETFNKNSSKTYTSSTIKDYISTTYPFTVNTSYKLLATYIDEKQSYSQKRTFYLSDVSITVEYSEHSHSYTTETARTPSTCYTKGSVTKKCSCGETQTTELALDPNNHAGGTEIRNSVSATCTATGYTGDTYCKGCGAKLSNGSTIAKLSHTEVTIPAVAPTCTTTGLTAGKKCSVCGTIITAQQTISALGHTYSTPSITLAGRKFICSCGYSYDERAYDMGFDNLFSLADWIHSSSATVDRGKVSYNIHEGTITTTSFTKEEADAWIAGASNRTESQALDCYTKYGASSSFFRMAVAGNTQYTVSFNIDNDNGQCFVFFYNSNGACSPAHYNLENGGQLVTGMNKRVFTTPSDCTMVQIRFGSTGVYNTTTTFSNIRICKSSMEDITNEKYRKVFFANEAIGELYTPERNNYAFKGWYTGENGTGSKITTSSKFAQSAIAYSLWELSRINNILVDTRQSSEVLLNLQEADEIYKDLIKVYG